MKMHVARLFLPLIVGLTLAACGGAKDTTQINVAAIQGVTAPAFGSAPATSIDATSQYTGTVTWSPAVSGTFSAETVYTATITLTAKTGYTLQGVSANFFTVAGATSVTNAANSGVISASFPATEAEPGPVWQIPGDYNLNIGVFFGETSLGAINVDTLTGVRQVILTSETGRVMPSYLLTEVLDAAGISIPTTYAGVAAQRNTVVSPSNDVTAVADITKAFLVLARIDTDPIETANYPRIIADGTISITTASIRQGFERLVFTPVDEEEAWEIPASYNASIGVFNGATSIGTATLTRASLAGINQVTLTSTQGRAFASYPLTDVLGVAGIVIPSTVAEAQNAAGADTSPISNITKAYLVVARIDEVPPTTYDTPRVIVDGTGAFGNGDVRSNFEKLVFTTEDENEQEESWEIPASYNASIGVFNGATSIGTATLTKASLAGLEQTILTSTGSRKVVTYLLTDVLQAAGIIIPAAYSTLTGQPNAPDPNPNDVTAIADITKAYVIVARIDEAPPATYEPYPRIIADGTVEFSNNAIRSGFERLLFTP